MHTLADLTRAVDRLLNHVSHWEPARWSAPAGTPDGTSRGDLMHALIQRIADDAAAAEGEPLREVPRLDNDGALPDQLRVVATDLAAAGPTPAALTATIEALRAAGRLL